MDDPIGYNVSKVTRNARSVILMIPSPNPFATHKPCGLSFLGMLNEMLRDQEW
jgi:hypothetical protein